MNHDQVCLQLWARDMPEQYDRVVVRSWRQVCDELPALPAEVRDRLRVHLMHNCPAIALRRGTMNQALDELTDTSRHIIDSPELDDWDWLGVEEQPDA